MITSPSKYCKPIKLNAEELEIRLVCENDIPAIRSLVNAAYKELSEMGLNYTGTYQDERVTQDRISRGCAFVLEQGKKILGTVLFSERNFFTNLRTGYVSQLAIDPSFKRSGLGTILMDLCEDIASSEGFEAIQLDTAKPALHLVAWYQKRGYKIIGEVKIEGKTYESWIFEKKF